jgi:hypothetical protein
MLNKYIEDNVCFVVHSTRVRIGFMIISPCDQKGAGRMKIFALGKDRSPPATELAMLVGIWRTSNPSRNDVGVIMPCRIKRRLIRTP